MAVNLFLLPGLWSSHSHGTLSTLIWSVRDLLAADNLSLGTLLDTIHYRETDRQRDTERQRLQLPGLESEKTSGLCLSSHDQRYVFYTLPAPYPRLPIFILISEQIFKLIPSLFLCPLVNKFVPVPKKQKGVSPRRKEQNTYAMMFWNNVWVCTQKGSLKGITLELTVFVIVSSLHMSFYDSFLTLYNFLLHRLKILWE